MNKASVTLFILLGACSFSSAALKLPDIPVFLGGTLQTASDKIGREFSSADGVDEHIAKIKPIIKSLLNYTYTYKNGVKNKKGILNYSYECDAQGRTVAYKQYDNGEMFINTKTTYDETNKSVTVGYNTDGTIKDNIADTYDDQHNVIESIRYRTDGSIEFRATWAYDSLGKEIFQREYR